MPIDTAPEPAMPVPAAALARMEAIVNIRAAAQRIERRAASMQVDAIRCVARDSVQHGEEISSLAGIILPGVENV